MSKKQDNDIRIRELKSKISEELGSLNKISKDFQTNLVLTFQDKKYILQALPIMELKELYIRLYLYLTVLPKLSMTDFEICGFGVQQWVHDIELLINIKQQEQRVNKLRKDLNKLDSLMSDEAKTSDYLDNLESFLKNDTNN